MVGDGECGSWKRRVFKGGGRVGLSFSEVVVLRMVIRVL